MRELFTEQSLVVVLTEHEHERIGCQPLARFTERHARHLSSARPQIDAGAGPAELEGSLREPEMRIDFERARMHPERPTLASGPFMAVDDQHTHAPARELDRHHQARRACTHDQHVRIHEWKLPEVHDDGNPRSTTDRLFAAANFRRRNG